MRTFPSYDHTLCKTESCEKKERCVRYLTYQKARNEKYEYMLTIYVPQGEVKDCQLFLKSEE